MASTAETLTAQAPSPGMVPAAEASAAGSLASLSTQVHTLCPDLMCGPGLQREGWVEWKNSHAALITPCQALKLAVARAAT